jgi:hypothetical protein
MQKNTKSRLALKTTTVRSLSGPNLAAAAGGMIKTSDVSVDACSADCGSGTPSCIRGL